MDHPCPSHHLPLFLRYERDICGILSQFWQAPRECHSGAWHRLSKSHLQAFQDIQGGNEGKRRDSPPNRHNNIIIQAYDCITDKRSVFGRNALAVVSAFFEEAKYVGNQDCIKQYVVWALRDGGPMYFSEPIPNESTTDKDDLAYVVSVHCPAAF